MLAEDLKKRPLATVGKLVFAGDVLLALTLMGLDKSGIVSLGKIQLGGDDGVSIAFLIAVFAVLSGGGMYQFFLVRQQQLDQKNAAAASSLSEE